LVTAGCICRQINDLPWRYTIQVADLWIRIEQFYQRDIMIYRDAGQCIAWTDRDLCR